MSPTTPSELRQRIVEIDDELQGLAPDAFGRKHELASEADSCRKLLAKIVEPDLNAASKKWAERSGRKGSHAQDPEKLKGAIVSPHVP